MAAITAKDVAALRAKTGLGMMDCKKALVEAEGDMEKAVKILREKGLATAAKKEGRIAAEGVVDIMTEGDVTAMIEVNSETDFVAKNATFQEFVKNLLATLISTKPADLDAFMATKYADTETTVADKLVEMVALIGEKIKIRRFEIVEGTVSTYIHGADSAAFAECAKNVALQIAAGNPPKYVYKEEVPASEVEEEKAVLIRQAKNDPKNANKPDEIIEKIIVGGLNKFYKEICLLQQPFVKDDKVSVEQHVAAVAKQVGGSIEVKAYVRFEKGEGIEKKQDNFAEEIASMVK